MTASEQRLALALGVILIGGGAFLGLNKLKAWKQNVDAHAADVTARRAETLSVAEFLALAQALGR